MVGGGVDLPVSVRTDTHERPHEVLARVATLVSRSRTFVHIWRRTHTHTHTHHTPRSKRRTKMRNVVAHLLQRWTFENACYTLYCHLPSLFQCFTLELKTYPVRESYPLTVPPRSVSVCQTDLIPELFAHQFFVLVLFLTVLVTPHVRQTIGWPALGKLFDAR